MKVINNNWNVTESSYFIYLNENGTILNEWTYLLNTNEIFILIFMEIY